MSTIVTLARALVWLLPPSAVKNSLVRALGSTVGRDVRLGPNLVLGPVRFALADGASIGSFNVFRALREVRLDTDAYIGNLNQITAVPAYRAHDPGFGLLHLSPGAGMTNRHYVDCSGRFVVGTFSMIAGVRSVFQTHELDLAENRARAGDIIVGERCFTGTGVQMLQNSYLPDRSLLASGSTRIRTAAGDPAGQLYAGTPAQARKDITGWAWFRRDVVHTPVLPGETPEALR